MKIMDLQSEDFLKSMFQEISLPLFYVSLNDGTFPLLKSLAL